MGAYFGREEDWVGPGGGKGQVGVFFGRVERIRYMRSWGGGGKID